MVRGPAYVWTSAQRPCNSQVCYSRKIMCADVCVSAGKAVLVIDEQLVRYF